MWDTRDSTKLVIPKIDCANKTKKNCLASVVVVWLLFHICWCDRLYVNFKLLPLYWLKLMMTESVWSSLEYALSKLKFCFGLLFPNMFDSFGMPWISTVSCCCRKGSESSVMSWGTHSSKVIYSSVENKLRVGQWKIVFLRLRKRGSSDMQFAI